MAAADLRADPLAPHRARASVGSFQTTLFGTQPVGLQPLGTLITRHQLDECCWIDVGHGWLQGADDLLVDLLDALEWFQGRRLMYGTFHDEPRLSSRGLEVTDPAVPTIIRTLAHGLDRHYHASEHTRRFDRVFCNYYRNGSDSVAWHADRVGRQQVDPLVAIVCCGGPRPFRVRPMGGGVSQSFDLGSGDLLVMGGAMQHHWEHAVPKVRHANPRMSVTLRGGPGAVGRDLRADGTGDLSRG